MALPEPELASAKVVLHLPNPTQRRQDHDDVFIAAVREEFPSIGARQLLPPEAPLVVPHLILQSTASRVAVSAVGSDLETRFYADYRSDVDRSFEYISRKTRALIQGWESIGERPSFVGVIVVAHFSFGDEAETSPAQFIAETHLACRVPSDLIQDASFKVALKLDNHHFINLAVANYETKTLERPVFPGNQFINVKAWEGSVDDTGIELTVDVNNRLAAITSGVDPEVSADDVDAALTITRHAIVNARDTLIESAELDLAALIGEPR